MRIARLELIAYGPFRGLELDLSAPGVHVVFGRNEAGKSTTLRAISGLLYGIDTRTLDAHLHKPSELRVGGTLTSTRDGTRVRLVRRKGVSKGGPNTLLDESGQAIDETVLQRFLGGVSEETFHQAFGLDHDMLQKGAKALLEGQGDIGGSIFDASVGGGGDARRLLEHLKQEAERLYKPRASAPPLNDALRAHAEAVKAIKEKQSLPEAFVSQQRALEEATSRRDALVARRIELSARHARIERARRRAPLERKRAQAVTILAELGAIAPHAARVESLQSRLLAYERASAASRDDAAASDRLRERVAEAARRAGVPAGAKELRIDVRTQSRIQRLVQERTTLGAGLEKLRAELASRVREHERERVSRPVQQIVDGVAMAALARAVDEARKLGDLANRHATELARAARRRTEVESRVAALSAFEEGASRTIEELVALRPPSESALEELGKQALELERLVTRLSERAAELDNEAQSLARQLAEAGGAFAPPGANDLAEARATRDEAWTGLRAARAEGAGAAALVALESSFERAVRDTDVIADRMIVEADRVTALSRLRALEGTNAQQRSQVEWELEKARERRLALEEEHRALWALSAITPRKGELGVAAGRAWLGKHAQIVEAFASVREAEADAEETARTMEVARGELTAALGATSTPMNEKATLANLLDVAVARIDRLEQQRRAEEESVRAIAKLEALIDERRAEVQRDEALVAETQARLVELVTPLGIPADVDADEVTRALDALRELFTLEDQRADVEARAITALAEARAYEEEAERAATELAPDLSTLPARDVVLALAARAKKATDAAEQLVELDRELDDPTGEVILDDLVALVADPEAAGRALEEVATELAEVERLINREVHGIGGIEVGIEKMRVDSGAAEASAQAQEALARVRVNVERYLRAKVAAVVLAREIERYREENQAPMLTRASQLFARLTLGSFSGVREGYDDRDRPALRCVRDGNLEVDITGLSEGTRDQLYLSLRLASLLHYAEIAEPMPLVLDDVLIQFDDERSRAALAVIAEVASHMQVLFFTHHARMVELARAAVPAASLTIHELAPAQAVIAAVTAAP